MQVSGAKTKQEAVDRALREMVARGSVYRALRKLKGQMPREGSFGAWRRRRGCSSSGGSYAGRSTTTGGTPPGPTPHTPCHRAAQAMGSAPTHARVLSLRLDAQASALGQNHPFEGDGEYPLDFVGYLEPIGTYEDLLPHAESVSIGGRPTRVIGLDDLIRIKRHIGRPKDRESLLQLEAIKRLREQEGLR